jgi:hypothetical protein
MDRKGGAVMDDRAMVEKDVMAIEVGLLLDRAKEVAGSFRSTRRLLAELQQKVDDLVTDGERVLRDLDSSRLTR